jgi:hypothetical protein
MARKKKKIEILWFEEQKSLLLMLQILQGLRRQTIDAGFLFLFFNLNFVRKYMGLDPGLMILIRLTKI